MYKKESSIMKHKEEEILTTAEWVQHRIEIKPNKRVRSYYPQIGRFNIFFLEAIKRYLQSFGTKCKLKRGTEKKIALTQNTTKKLQVLSSKYKIVD